MTEQMLKQEVMIDGQQVLSIATPDIVTNHVNEKIYERFPSFALCAILLFIA